VYVQARHPLARALLAAGVAGLAAGGRDAGAQPPRADTSARPRLVARRAAGPVRVDGRLDEAAWAAAPVAAGFRTVEPTEGRPSAFDTRVRVVYDERALYVAVDARDPLGRRGIRVQDLRRKFDYFQNDLFGVSFDALHDGRLVSAYGVAAARLETRGHGASKPVMPNVTLEGRAANRRVELVRR
jgi:hypothetical protein